MARKLGAGYPGAIDHPLALREALRATSVMNAAPFNIKLWQMSWSAAGRSGAGVLACACLARVSQAGAERQPGRLPDGWQPRRLPHYGARIRLRPIVQPRASLLLIGRRDA